MKRPPLLRAWRERLRSSRWRLWAALLLLVVSLLVVLVFLAAEYEESRDQTALEQDAAALGSDIRSSLVRNVQTLQSLHSVAPTADSWIGPAAELIAQHRQIIAIIESVQARAPGDPPDLDESRGVREAAFLQAGAGAAKAQDDNVVDAEVKEVKRG